MNRALIGMAALCGLVGGGCLYTDDINTAPTAEIQHDNPEVVPFTGEQLRLSARKSTDPDDDPLRYLWRARRCSAAGCDTDHFQDSSAREFIVTIPDKVEGKRLIQVELTVEDSHGAQASASPQLFTVLNRAPSVTVQVQGIASPTGGFTVGRPLVVIATATDLDDCGMVGMDLVDCDAALDLTWTPFPVAGSDPEVREWSELVGAQCPPPADQYTKQECYHLRPDVAGLWRVQVEVSDGVDADDLTESILIDPDKPPCVETTVPELVPGATYVLERGDDVRRFAALSVSDELDPYPLPPNDNDPDRGTATFRWWLASPDTSGLRVEIDHTLADYYLDPSLYAPGDELELRVEASDRVDRALPCADDAPTCSIDDDGCLQRVSWKVEIR